MLTHFDAVALRRDPLYKDFFAALNGQQLGFSQLFPTYDISAILSLLQHFGDNATMPISDLTRRLCWLLAITGFLRPSDIHRIDLDQSCVAEDQLHLAVVAPKEKRQGRPYVKSVVIHAHSNALRRNPRCICIKFGVKAPRIGTFASIFHMVPLKINVYDILC